MQCLFVADLHYSLPQFDWLLQSAPRYDVVVLAGDALDIGSNVDFRAQTLVVRKYLQRIAATTRLIVCWSHHAPPLNSPTSWSGTRSIGDQDIETWIYQYAPDIVVAGHIHQSPFVKN